MGPHWLGSPQHVVAGVLLGGAVVLVARRWVSQWWLLLALGVGVTSAAEILVELVEYPLLYSDRSHGSTYYWDTLADLASTLAGAFIGSGLVLLVRRARPEA